MPAGETARTDLEALFGAGPSQDNAASSADNITETEQARRALEDLFGGGKGNDAPGSS